ncbi:F510_1955 family glycosylhydrolase [Geodermatophilus sp. SYSU D01176]
MPLTRSTTPSARALAVGAVATVLGTLLAGCSGAGPAPAADPPASATSPLELTHVHGAAFDPEDGSLRLATHHGLVEVAGGAPTPVGPVIDLMGFTVAGPGHYLASGHPGPHVDLPQPVGLIESTDGGHTWTPVSRQGQSDFHALTVSAAGVLGYDGTLVASTDGRAWQQLQIPAEPHTLAATPDGGPVLATTAQGLLRSTDGGTSWTAVDGPPPLQVAAWADSTTAVGVDPGGTLWTSTDAATTWQEGPELGSPPEAVAATTVEGRLRIAVVTAAGVLETRDGGRTFTDVLSG